MVERWPVAGRGEGALCQHSAGIAGARDATHGVRPGLRVLLRPLCRYASIILLADDAWLLTELSNVVAYPCRHSRAEDRPMSTVRSTPQVGSPDIRAVGLFSNWPFACGNCGKRRLPAGPKHWMQACGDQRFGHQCFLPNSFKDLATPARSSSGWRQVSSHCHIFVIGQ